MTVTIKFGVSTQQPTINPRIARPGVSVACLFVASAWSVGVHADSPAAQSAATATDLAEIVVTATRRAETIDTIPISISAFSQERMDEQGIKSVDDLARFTPGLTFAPSTGGITNDIAIRGVLSEVGASTTGIYIDDTPIQVRSKGIATESAFPQLFDLERVEVLRGPQGTLFGTGSEGGTIRFITPEPDLEKYSVYSRVEGSSTKSGDPSYEMGVAAGGPIIDGTLGFRVSVFYQSQGGFINRVPFTGTTVADKDINFDDTTVLRGAVKWAVSDAVTITPSIFFQRKRKNDDYFWLDESNPDRTDFNSGYTQPTPSLDTFTLPALKVDWKFDGAELISDTSFFYRKLSRTSDYSEFNWWALVGDGSPTPNAPVPYYRVISQDEVRQNSFTQEVRLQSTTADSPLQWVTGALFQSARLYTNQYLPDPDLPAVSQLVYGAPIQAVFGEGLVDGIYSYAINQWATDKQTALFGQADYSFTSNWKATLGVRVARDTLDYNRDQNGPLNGGFERNSGTAPTTTPVTPKIGLSYLTDDHSLYYVSVSKGTREGGVNNPVIASGSVGCPVGLAAPNTFASDSLWSYEIGAKNQFAGGRLHTQASLYYIDWQHIQQNVNDNGCLTASYVDNLGGAAIKGGDLAAEWKVLDQWALTLSGGYTLARYSSTAYGAPEAVSGIRAVVARDGDSLGVSPWNLTLSSKYDFVAWDHNSYFRLDYSYTAKDTGETPQRDPLNASIYDPGLVADPAVRLLGARLGMQVGGFDISVFGRNILNQTPPLGINHDGVGDPSYYAVTVRPRTLGVTATYRY
jgi:outer membrane receptor protein involved in Fe transport